MIGDVTGVNPLTGVLVLSIGAAAIATIIVYLVRMGTRQGDEKHGV